MVRVSIFDLDGTLIDHEWRLPMIVSKDAIDPNMQMPKGANRFSLYHSNIKNDTNTVPAGMFALDIAKQNVDTIVFSTARPESAREDTITQIRELLGLGTSQYYLFMRAPDQEEMPSEALKLIHIGQIQARLDATHMGNVSAIDFFDDHARVVTAVNGRFLLGCKIAGYWVNKIGLFREEILSCLKLGQPLKSGESIGNRKVGAHVKLSGNGALIGQQTDRLSDALAERNACSIYLTPDMVPDGIHMDSSMEVMTVKQKAMEVLGWSGRSDVDYSHRSHQRASRVASVAPTGPAAMQLDDEAGAIPQAVAVELESLGLAGRSAADILQACADTFRERNAEYKDNAIVVGRVMDALFPGGVVLKTAADFHIWHLFELIIVKLTRFTNSNLRHEDSMRDMAVYCAMVELLTNTHNIEIKE